LMPCSRSCGAHLLVAVHVFGVPSFAGFGVVTVLVSSARAALAVSTVTGGVPWWTAGYVLAGRAGRQVVAPVAFPALSIGHLTHPPAIIADERNVVAGVCPPIPSTTHDAAIFGSTGAARDSWAGEPEVIPPNLSASACACGLCWPWVALRVARLARRRAGGAVRSAAGWYVRVLHCGMTPTRRPLAAVCALPARCAAACVGPPVRGARAAVLAWVVVASFRVLTCWARPAALAAAGVATSVGDAAAVAAIRAVVAPCRVVTALAGRMTPAALAGAAVVAPVGDAAAVPAVGVAVAAGRVAAGIT
jgi:hypothetical protein